MVEMGPGGSEAALRKLLSPWSGGQRRVHILARVWGFAGGSQGNRPRSSVGALSRGLLALSTPHPPTHTSLLLLPWEGLGVRATGSSSSSGNKGSLSLVSPP